MSSVNKKSFIYSFPVCIIFIPFAYLTALATTSSTTLQRIMRGDILALYMILVEKYRIFHY